MPLKSPIAVFGYRRSAQLASLLESLESCVGFEGSPVTIFVDGPKGEADRLEVETVRRLVTELPWSNLEIQISDVNKGLRASILDGVTHVLARYPTVIVLEEDLVLSPMAIEYFNMALDKYAGDDRVWSVGGFMYDVKGLLDRKSALVLPFAHPWGWATWRHAWERFDPSRPVSPELLGSGSFRNRFNLSGLANFTRMLELAEKGLVDSWYVYWYFQITMENGVSIFPPRTYVSNRGIGGAQATHGSPLNPHRYLVRQAAPSPEIVTMPRTLEIDYIALDQIRGSWDARVTRMAHTLGAAKRRLRSWLD